MVSISGLVNRVLLGGGFFYGPPTKEIPGGSPLELCDASSQQLLTINSLEISPNPPQRGQNLTIVGDGLLLKAIEDGAYVDVVVNYGYIKLIQQTYDLCEELPQVGMECPLEKGEYDLIKAVELPSQIPPGKYTVSARAYTKDDDLITCLTGSIEFTPQQ